jgi:hypothetical protein
MEAGTVGVRGDWLPFWQRRAVLLVIVMGRVHCSAYVGQWPTLEGYDTSVTSELESGVYYKPFFYVTSQVSSVALWDSVCDRWECGFKTNLKRNQKSR